MFAKVIGTRKIDFDTKDGKHIRGVSAYITYPTHGVDGVMAEKIFVSADKCDVNGVIVGATLDVAYNRWGKVENVKVVDNGDDVDIDV